MEALCIGSLRDGRRTPLPGLSNRPGVACATRDGAY